jgi:large repetitive protein
MAAAVLALICGCGQKVLTVVGPCPDGGTVSGSAGCAPPGLLDDLVGYWQLDDAPGSAIANDLTGRNDGTLVGLDPATAWVTGQSAGGLAVEAAGFVNVPPSPSIDSITDQVTIAGWGYLEGTIMDYATIASREDATGIDQHYHISIDQRTETPVLFLKTDTGGVRLTTATAVTRQTWIHIAGTYDGNTARIFVDGQEAVSQGLTGRFTPDITPFILGGNGNGTGDANVTERFPGRVDEIMLYRRALSAGEIMQLHDGALFP